MKFSRYLCATCKRTKEVAVTLYASRELVAKRTFIVEFICCTCYFLMLKVLKF